MPKIEHARRPGSISPFGEDSIEHPARRIKKFHAPKGLFVRNENVNQDWCLGNKEEMTKMLTPSKLDSFPSFKVVNFYWNHASKGYCFEGCSRESAYYAWDDETKKSHNNFQSS